MGLGYVLSFVPIASMLIMPMRLLSGIVLATDVWISLGLSSLLLVGVFILGYPAYRLGLQRE